ncbi:MAG TPA: carboxypeptidase-like regulatory domain-containing protein [Candidatus Saccharimonadales bacterium]|nr:carboxypeptidase-like regulatory domain-containing protein [Candidatus Saccharimonadales bacterium]
MLSRNLQRSWAVLLVSLLTLVMALPAELLADAPATTSIGGKVLDQDGVTPVGSLIVRLRNRATGDTYESKPTDTGGGYKIQDVPDGDYAIIISTGAGDFELPNSITIQGGRPSMITVILTVAASDAAHLGAPARPRRRKKAAILIPSIGAILVLAFAADEVFEKDNDASPKLP